MFLTRIALLSAAAALAAACHSSSRVPAPLASIDLPKGEALKPWSASTPSKPWPQAMAQVGDRVWVALGNLAANDPWLPPAGPGMLVGIVPSTGAQTVIDLGGADGRQCSNPGAVRADGGKLYVTCSGPFGSSEGKALVEVDPSGSGSVKRFAAMPAGFAPGAVAIAGNRIWLGDLAGANVLGVNRSTFQPDPAPKALGCPADYPFVSNMIAVANDLYVLCAAADGYIFRLDATTGEPKADKALVGAQPIALAYMGDGRIAVVNSTSGTLSLVTPGASLQVARDALALQNSADLEDVRALGQFVYIASASTQTVVKVDASGQTPKIVDEVSVNPSGEPNANPSRLEVLDDDTAVVSDSGRGRVYGVRFGKKK